MPTDPIFDVTRVIQLAVAPVFLLTSLGTFLGVLNGRLHRIVDRARALGERLPATSGRARERTLEEVSLLVRRRSLVNASITFGTSSALLVCVLIATAFVASLVHRNFSFAVAALFVLAMLLFIGALLTFLAEILLAVGNVRFAIDLAGEEDHR